LRRGRVKLVFKLYEESQGETLTTEAQKKVEQARPHGTQRKVLAGTSRVKDKTKELREVKEANLQIPKVQGEKFLYGKLDTGYVNGRIRKCKNSARYRKKSVP